MEGLKSQVNDFLTKCAELKNCKFIMAPTKIKDLLKSVVNSRALYDLFTSVSTDFDYAGAKSRCLIEKNDGYGVRGKLVLPESSRERLAFIFCLLVEIDRDSINFNWFLQKYFSDDGSYYGSYLAFCERVIDPLERIIRGVFASDLEDERRSSAHAADKSSATAQTRAKPVVLSSNAAQTLSVINLLIAQEKQFILESAIPADDKETGYKMLTQIYNCLKERAFEVANSLVCGYNYYILYNNTISSNVQMLFENIRAYEEMA